MLFNGFEFWIFFAVVLGVYWVLPRRAQNLWLLAASYFFYGVWDVRFLSLLVLSTVVDFAVGRKLGGTSDLSARRRLLGVSLGVNLGILGFFKYAGFFAESLRALAGSLGLEVSGFALEVVLPVGISFYTFQTLSYTIDVYRGRLEPAERIEEFALFVAFFPQLVAGPIERASRLLPQIGCERTATPEAFRSGLWLAAWGLFKKAVIADNLAVLVDRVYAVDASPTGPEVVVATWAFAFQIYCDFSGYTDVARGVARMLGFDLMVNFRLPYFSANPAEHWRRWHVSLSEWLRDYLYLSLGGNRTGHTYRNLMVTMTLGGLWHGAAWTFVLWGAFHGMLLVLHRRFAPLVDGWGRSLPGEFSHGVRVLLMFHATCLGYMIFRSDSISHLLALCGALADPALGAAGLWLRPLLFLLAPLLLIETVQAATGDLEVERRWSFGGRLAIGIVVVVGLAILGEDGGAPFIYFQF